MQNLYREAQMYKEAQKRAFDMCAGTEQQQQLEMDALDAFLESVSDSIVAESDAILFAYMYGKSVAALEAKARGIN